MPELRVVIAVAAATSLVVSLATALLLSGGDNEAPAVAAAPTGESERVPTADGSELAALRSALERERNARLALTRQIDDLSQAIEEGQPLASRPASGAANRTAPEPRNAVDPESELAESWFSEQALRDQDMSENEIQRLRQRFDEVELEKLYARDRAAREGWADSSRHYREMRDIQTQFREELGERDYDAVLYASGRNNRVRVQDLLHGSAAANSGVQPGDVIVSYAGERIFDPSTLYMWSKEGRAGENVQLEVQRGNEIVTFEVPRGPLGGKMEHFASPPGS